MFTRRTKRALLLLLCLCAWGPTARRAERGTYANPVIAGDFPDPSVIRVGRGLLGDGDDGRLGPARSPSCTRRTSSTGAWPARFSARRPPGRKATSGPPKSRRTAGATSSTTRRGATTARRKLAHFAWPSRPRPRPPGRTRIAARSCAKSRSAEAWARLTPSSCATRRARLTSSGRPTATTPSRTSRPPSTHSRFPKTARSSKAAAKKSCATRPPGRGTSRRARPSSAGAAGSTTSTRATPAAGARCDYALGVARSRKLLGPWEKYQREPHPRRERRVAVSGPRQHRHHRRRA